MKTLLKSNPVDIFYGSEPTFSLDFITDQEFFNPEDWFYGRSSYDGYAQIHFSKKVDNSFICNHVLLENKVEQGEPRGWHFGYGGDKYKSLEDADASIPASCRPLFECGVRPEPKKADITKFRSPQHWTSKDLDIYKGWVIDHNFITHYFYDLDSEEFFSFDREEIWDDIKSFYGLSNKEIYRIRNYDLASYDGQYFSIRIPAYRLTDSEPKEKKSFVNAIKKMIAKTPQEDSDT